MKQVPHSPLRIIKVNECASPSQAFSPHTIRHTRNSQKENLSEAADLKLKFQTLLRENESVCKENKLMQEFMSKYQQQQSDLTATLKEENERLRQKTQFQGAEIVRLRGKVKNENMSLCLQKALTTINQQNKDRQNLETQLQQTQQQIRQLEDQLKNSKDDKENEFTKKQEQWINQLCQLNEENVTLKQERESIMLQLESAQRENINLRHSMQQMDFDFRQHYATLRCENLAYQEELKALRCRQQLELQQQQQLQLQSQNQTQQPNQPNYFHVYGIQRQTQDFSSFQVQKIMKK